MKGDGWRQCLRAATLRSSATWAPRSSGGSTPCRRDSSRRRRARTPVRHPVAPIPDPFPRRLHASERHPGDETRTHPRRPEPRIDGGRIRGRCKGSRVPQAPDWGWGLATKTWFAAAAANPHGARGPVPFALPASPPPQAGSERKDRPVRGGLSVAPAPPRCRGGWMGVARDPLRLRRGSSKGRTAEGSRVRGVALHVVAAGNRRGVRRAYDPCPAQAGGLATFLGYAEEKRQIGGVGRMRAVQRRPAE